MLCTVSYTSTARVLPLTVSVSQPHSLHWQCWLGGRLCMLSPIQTKPSVIWHCSSLSPSFDEIYVVQAHSTTGTR